MQDPAPCTGAGSAMDADSETLPKAGAGVKLASAFNGSSSLVALTRLADDRYVDVNDSFERAVGQSREALIGKQPAEAGIWEPDARGDFLKRLREHRSRSQQIAYRRRDGSQSQGLLNASIVTLDGEHYVFSSFEH